MSFLMQIIMQWWIF